MSCDGIHILAAAGRRPFCVPDSDSGFNLSWGHICDNGDSEPASHSIDHSGWVFADVVCSNPDDVCVVRYTKKVGDPENDNYKKLLEKDEKL